jgi:hypothetical protein
MERVNHDWFHRMAATCELPQAALHALHETGFIVMPGPLAQAELARLDAAYDATVRAAQPDDVSVGSTTTRVNDFVNRGADFDQLYVYPPLLAACCSIIGQPFKLSTLHARTVRPYAPAQALHIDFKGDARGWPMIGFIIMVDEFRSDNGATRFVPRSHMLPHVPGDVLKDAVADYEGQALACGPAGSIIIYNGSTWHGHTANRSAQPRRSIQGAFIRREAQSAVNQRTRIRPETLERIGGLAKYLLALPPDDDPQA